MDDQFGLPRAIRWVSQIAAALLLVACGIRIHVSFGGHLAVAYSVIFTVIWILVIINVVEFIDDVDGLAAGVSFITAVCLLAVSAQFQGTGRAGSTLLMAGVAGASLGFLRHNFPPARAVMGDSGAYFLGYVIAAASILGHLKIHAVFALGPTALFVLFPTLRMARVMVRRLLRRRNPLVIGGLTQRDHRILTRLSPVRTCLVLWGFSLVLNVAGMVREHMSLSVILTTVVGVLVLLAAILLVPRPLGTGHRLRSKPESERSG